MAPGKNSNQKEALHLIPSDFCCCGWESKSVSQTLIKAEIQWNVSPLAARALFRGTLGKEVWYFPAVMGLIIEGSKLHGASKTALSPNQEPCSRGVDPRPGALQLHPWEFSTVRKEKEDSAVKGSRSQLCTHAEVPKLSPKNYVSPTHTLCTNRNSALFCFNKWALKRKGREMLALNWSKWKEKKKLSRNKATYFSWI